MNPRRFSDALLRWYTRHGRSGLPWQQDPTPYRVWVSEIMLQQTRVGTVVNYYRRFVARFPEVQSLALADPDEVLSLWSGLGYYARARHLHRAARLVCDRHDGELPGDIETLQSLPGIGRSTAGAILALAGGQRHPILDGNVKRVLCRFHGIAGWPGEAAISRQLWTLAEQHTPQRRVEAYTQAIMDLGATVCVRSRPVCTACPLQADCTAHRQRSESSYPAPKPKRPRPCRRTTFLILRNRTGRVLLQRRPPTGVWGGLWGFPECPPDADPADWTRRHLGFAARSTFELPCVQHGFTHFELEIKPVLLTVDSTPGRAGASGTRVAESAPMRWYASDPPPAVGLAAPVAALLSNLGPSPRSPER